MAQQFIHPGSTDGENPKFKMMSTALAHLVLSVGGGMEIPRDEIARIPAGELICTYDKDGALQLVYNQAPMIGGGRTMDPRYTMVSTALSAILVASGGGIRIAPEAITELPPGDLNCNYVDGAMVLVFQREQ